MPAPAAIEVADLTKTFRLPRHKVQTLKEKALHPFRRIPADELRVLRGISFRVEPGEFFGIVGRNGSGKSTLLKCLAGIYRADTGRIWVAGRLAPFIELGVGFNPELTARDNVVINAVMMGLTPREARGRFDAIMAFAELEEFVDLKLKNYSSGMQVRLAFSVMVQSDSDILLIDEVLAVGDAAFQQKCLDVFYELRDRGQTIVLVTHDMGMVERFCHRALLIDEGRIGMEGAPDEVGRRYLELNFENERARAGRELDDDGDETRRARVVDVWVEDGAGQRVRSVAEGDRLHLHATIGVSERLQSPHLTLWIDSPEWTRVFGAGSEEILREPLEAGERVDVHVSVENLLAPNRYMVGCAITEGTARTDIVDWRANGADFVVFSSAEHHGLVALEHTFELERSRGPSPASAVR